MKNLIEVAGMNTCGTCKYRGEEITKTDYSDDGDFGEINTGYFLCKRIEHDDRFDYKRGQSALVKDGSGYYAALCVEDDFGCVKWEGK